MVRRKKSVYNKKLTTRLTRMTLIFLRNWADVFCSRGNVYHDICNENHKLGLVRFRSIVLIQLLLTNQCICLTTSMSNRLGDHMCLRTLAGKQSHKDLNTSFMQIKYLNVRTMPKLIVKWSLFLSGALLFKLQICS